MLDSVTKDWCLERAIEIAKAHAQSNNPKHLADAMLEDLYNMLKKLKEDAVKDD